MPNLFSKIRSGATRFFNKVGSEAPRVLSTVSKVANTVGNIANSPEVAGIVGAVAPEALPYLGTVGTVAKQVGDLTNTKNYAGQNAGQVVNNVLERAQNIKSTLQSSPAFA